MSQINIGNIDNLKFALGDVEDIQLYLGEIKLYPLNNYKYEAKYTDGSVYHLDCDSQTGLTSADTRVNTYTDVSAVTVGNCIQTLKANAFRGFTSLSNVSLPKSLVNINGGAFMECTSLVSLKIPNGVTFFGNLAFENCTSLTTVKIPSGITSIPLQCFTNCHSLTSIEIPSGVTTINSSAFQNCSGLTEVVIPSSVTYINYAAFANCSGLTSIKMESATPPTLSNPSTSFPQPFDNTNDCPIYIPCNSTDAYTADTKWNAYASRFVEYGCSRLPDEYTEVEYIQNTASGENTSSTSRLAIQFEDSITNNESAYTYEITCELNVGNTSAYWDFCGNSYVQLQRTDSGYGNKFEPRAWGRQFKGSPAGTFISDIKYKIRIYQGVSDTYPTCEITNITAETTNAYSMTNTRSGMKNNSVKFGLFNFYNESDSGAHLVPGKIYSLKIYDQNNTLIADAVPCVRKSDNKCGFYNLARNEFEYDASGNLTLTAGPQVEN